MKHIIFLFLTLILCSHAISQSILDFLYGYVNIPAKIYKQNHIKKEIIYRISNREKKIDSSLDETIIYNDWGLQQKTIYPFGRTQSYFYDAENNLVKELDSSQDYQTMTIENAYDNNCNKIYTETTDNDTTFYNYAPTDKLLTTIEKHDKMENRKILYYYNNSNYPDSVLVLEQFKKDKKEPSSFVQYFQYSKNKDTAMTCRTYSEKEEMFLSVVYDAKEQLTKTINWHNSDNNFSFTIVDYTYYTNGTIDKIIYKHVYKNNRSVQVMGTIFKHYYFSDN